MADLAYLEEKARQALGEADGEKTRAARLLASWVATDNRLRDALVAPLLGNLCLLAIQRVAGRGGASSKRSEPTPGPLAGTALAAAIGEALAGKGAAPTTFGQPERRSPRATPGSVKHAQSVRTLASAFQTKRRPPGR